MKLLGQYILFSLALVCIGFTLALAQVGRGADGANEHTHTGDRMTYELKGGVVTLYPRDALAASLCFTDGKDGLIIEQGEVRNRCSHLRIENRTLETLGSQEYLSVGVQGGQYGILMDLGEESQLTRKYGYLTLPGLAFTSIHLNDGKILILKNRERKEFEELKEAMPFLQPTTNQMKPDSTLPIAVGHIYLARIIDRNDKSFNLWVKILILAHTPGQTVTMRWHLL